MFFEYGKRGQLEVICGPMFAGKSSELLRRLQRARIAHLQYKLFKSILDDRYSETEVVTHEGSKMPSIPIQDPNKIVAMSQGARIVAIDEVQFLDVEIIDVIHALVKDQKRVIVSGLDQDAFGNTFGSMGDLLASADFVTKLKSICTVCGEPASKTQALVDQKEVVQVGGNSQYTARCLKHWNPPNR